MTTLCPNCSRPARKGALYCGFCGTNLKSPGKEAMAAASIPQGNNSTSIKPIPQKQTKGKKKDRGRTAAIIAMILLFLIIIVAVLGQYWEEVLTYIVSSLSMLPAG